MNYLRTVLSLVCGALAFLAPAVWAADSQAKAEDFKSAYAEVNGIRMHYASRGEGPLVLFLHGYPAFWYQWKDQMIEMARTHRAVAPDLRGYNLTSRPAEVDAYAMKYLLEDVRQLVAHLNGNKKFILVGHDWGGAVAYTFAIKYPELVDKLIIINSGHPALIEREFNENPVQQEASHYMMIMSGYTKEPPPPLPPDNRETAERRLKSGFIAREIEKGHYTEEDRELWISAYSQPGSNEAGINWYRANHANPPFNSRVPAANVKRSFSATELVGANDLTVRVPHLVIWGLRDTALQTGLLSGLSKYAPGYRYKFYPDGDHWVFITHFKEVSRDIRDFIEGK